MFKMDVDDSSKRFKITAGGFFTTDEGHAFLTEYQTKIQLFNPKEFTLIVDAKDVKTSGKDVSEQLKGMMMLYMSVPFKKRILVQQDSPTALLQTKRLAKEVPGFDTIEFVDSIEDALK